MNYINIKQLNEDILNNVHLIPKEVDLIVGIPRSGMLVASLLSIYMNKPLSDLDSFVNGVIYNYGMTKDTTKLIKSSQEAKTILVVDDSISSGKSIEEAKKKLKNVSNNIIIIYLACYIIPEAKNKCDIYFKIVDLPRRFEWNLFHHVELENACVDIDGVLCMDPTEKENDDGEKYETFIKNARIKYIPSRKIGYIVTSRLEKYRNLTEEWLRNNNIKYGKLIMLDLPNAEVRRDLNNHGEFKGEVYKKLKDAKLFIESDSKQANEIQRISKKEVICVDNNNLICAKESFKRKNIKRIKRILKKVLTERQVIFLKRIKVKCKK